MKQAFLLVLLNGSLLFAQMSERFHRLGVEEGLAQSTVWRIMQDHYGFIWFATPDGLCRYDGQEIKTFRNEISDTLAPLDNYINAALFDSRGRFWLSSTLGLAQFDYDKDRIIHGRNGKPFLRFKERQWIINDIVEDVRGNLWIATLGHGLLRFDPATNTTDEFLHQPAIEPSLPSNDIRALLPADSLSWYVGTSQGLVLMDIRTGECHIPQTLPVIFRKMFINDLKKDRNGTLWVASAENGVFRYDPATGALSNVRSIPGNPNSLTDNRVNTLLIDRRGRVWVGTMGGLNCLDPTTGLITRFFYDPANAYGLSSNAIIALYVDSSENLWIGTQGNGANRLDLKRPKFTVLRNRPGASQIFSNPVIWRIVEDTDGDLWIATGSLTRLNRRTKTSKMFASPKEIQTLVRDNDGTLWISTRGGFGQIDQAGRITRFYRDGHIEGLARLSLPSYAVHVDAQGIFWIGAHNGHLVRFDPRRGSFNAFSPDGEPPDLTLNRMVTGIVENSHGDLYIARSIGVFRYSKQRNEFRQLPFDTPGRDTLRLSGALCIAMSRSNVLWIGTTRGLYSYHEATGRWRRFTDEDGLINDKIWAILEDHHGAIWVSTNKGIVRLTEKPGGTVSIRNYDGGDIPTTPDFNLGAALRSVRSGELFFGSTDGLVWFHPDSMQDNPYLPSVILTAFRKFDHNADLDGSISRLKELVLPVADNVFSFRFAALEFTYPAKNQYAYIMQGFENEWTYQRVRREVRYTSLPPGEYTFRVRASNNDGVWNEAGVALRIVVVPPFWQRWWFLLSMGAVLLGATGGAIRYYELRRIQRRLERLERERAVEIERARISRDMHDELGASLTSLSMITEIARRSLTQPQRAEEHLQKVASIASESVRKLDEIVWAVNPKADRLDHLAGYISEYAQEFFSTTGIRLRFDFPGQIPDLPLSSDVRQNIFLVVKEALHNIVKHAGASEANIGLALKDATAIFEVRDNGKGFDASLWFGGNGLGNMRRRMESVGGQIEFQSGNGGGTVVRIEIPLLPESMNE